jgi:hypothetical protein
MPTAGFDCGELVDAVTRFVPRPTDPVHGTPRLR